MAETLNSRWSTHSALSIPKEGFFKNEEGRYGPVLPQMPSNYGFTVVAKVKAGREQGIR